MKRALALGCLLVAALPSGSTAASNRTVELKMGDAVDVAGTRIACFALRTGGKNGMACVLWAKNKPLTGSYGVGLTTDGTAVLNKVKADGSSLKIFKRRLASVGAVKSKVYRLGVGSLFGLQIDARLALGCRVINVKDSSLAAFYRGVKVSCWRATATEPLPRTYGVSISDKFAGVFAFDAKSRVLSAGVVRRQPR
jgi:hypothetical protein